MRTETTKTGQPTVSELVRQNYRIADVLQHWGINYCCGGNLPLAEVCTLRGIDLHTVQHDIDRATRQVTLPRGLDYSQWPAEFLIDYIINVHHAYLHQVLPALQRQLQTFVTGHLKKYPYLTEVAEAFDSLAAELLAQMGREEEQIFPYLRQVAGTYVRRETYGALFVRMLGKPLEQQVAAGHNRVMALLQHLRSVSNQYQFAPDACTNYQVIYHKLKELDADLVQHHLLEQEALYPRLYAMERSLLQAGS